MEWKFIWDPIYTIYWIITSVFFYSGRHSYSGHSRNRRKQISNQARKEVPGKVVWVHLRGQQFKRRRRTWGKGRLLFWSKQVQVGKSGVSPLSVHFYHVSSVSINVTCYLESGLYKFEYSIKTERLSLLCMVIDHCVVGLYGLYLASDNPMQHFTYYCILHLRKFLILEMFPNTVKYFLFVWTYFHEASTLHIFTRHYFREFSYLAL